MNGNSGSQGREPMQDIKHSQEQKHWCELLTNTEEGVDIRKYYAPGYWDLLHRAFLKASRTQKKEDRDFALQLLDFIAEYFPCPDCRGHFQEMLANRLDFVEFVPIKKLFEWSVAAHNKVNEHAGSKCPPMSLDDAKAWYVGTLPPGK